MFKNESAQSQGIDTNRLFRVSDRENMFFGELVRLIKDDDTYSPYFKILSSGEVRGFNWRNLEYAEKSLDTLEVGDVLVDEYDNERIVLGICGKVYFLSISNDFDCANNPYTLKELKDDGWNLKGVKSEVFELTIDEIATKFNKKPNEIKIKK